MKPLEIKGNVIGHVGKLGSADIFFGNRHGELKILEEHYNFNVKFVKQVHGDKVVATAPVEADGHWTPLRGMAVGVYTADCLPVLISCEGTSRVMAVHAGWRGVRNQIVRKAKDFLISTGSHPTDLFVAIGPHITEKSFEIENDLGEAILQADPTSSVKGLPHNSPAKMYVPLKDVVRGQLFDVPQENFIFFPEDTLTNQLYFSHRRTPKEGRLINFIFRK